MKIKHPVLGFCSIWNDLSATFELDFVAYTPSSLFEWIDCVHEAKPGTDIQIKLKQYHSKGEGINPQVHVVNVLTPNT